LTIVNNVIACYPSSNHSMPYKNILLIDDDEDDQEIFLAALERIPQSVVCQGVTNATMALRKLVDKQIQTDVIFLDLNMPLMNGQQFLKEVKQYEALRDIPVIIFSTSSNTQTIKETKELGAYDFITKPDKFDDLVVILRSLIA